MEIFLAVVTVLVLSLTTGLFGLSVSALHRLVFNCHYGLQGTEQDTEAPSGSRASPPHYPYSEAD